MLITIVIPVYNRAGVVGRTLECVAAQTHRPLEVVLVDNDSTDHSLRVLEQFRDSHSAPGFTVVVASETDSHTAAAARQTGFGLATGEYVMFFDSDDLMTPDLAAAYASTLAAHPEADIVLARSVLLGTDGSRRELPFHTTDLPANQVLHSLMSSQRYAVRREFFAATDGWNTALRQWDDWELGLRLLLAGPRVAGLPGASRVTLVASGEESITGCDFASRAGRWEQVIDLNLTNVSRSALPEGERLRLTRLLEFVRLTLAGHYRREARADLADPLLQQALDAIRGTYASSLWCSAVVMPTLRLLHRHIAAGRRGAARVAVRLL